MWRTTATATSIALVAQVDAGVPPPAMQEAVKSMDACFMMQKGYWAYEVCMSKGIRQFHHMSTDARGRPLDKPVHIEHSLGTYSPDADEWHNEWLRPNAYTQHFSDGSGGRRAVVQFSCGRKDGISSLREYPLLHYEIGVRLQSLCTRGYGWQLLMSCVLGQIVFAYIWWFLARRRAGDRDQWRGVPFALPARLEVTTTQEPDEEPVGIPDALRAAPPPLPEPTPDLERTGECIICLEQIQRSAIGSCPHHFCVGCLLECCRLTPRCPRCLQPITAIHLDPEFDALLKLARDADTTARAGDVCAPERVEASQQPLPPPAEPSSSRSSELAMRRYMVRLMLPRGARAGITLRNCRWRFGVAVAALSEGKMAYRSGLRVGDVIVSMNNVPCRSHAQSIEIINAMSAPRSWADSMILCLVIPQAAHVKPLGIPNSEDDVMDDGGNQGDLVECALM